MNDGDKGEAGAECPSGKAYAYPDGHVSEMLPAAVVFTAYAVCGGFPETVLAKLMPDVRLTDQGIKVDEGDIDEVVFQR